MKRLFQPIIHAAIGCLFFCLVLFNVGYAQNSKRSYEEVDKHALSVPFNLSQNIDELTNYLTSPYESDLYKIRSIFVWVGSNINYDLDMLKSGNIKAQTPEETLYRRKAVCQGYAELVKAMCQRAKIYSYLVVGYSKALGSQLNQPFVQSNHAWNAVLIHGNWYLLDATWASGYVSDGGRRFVRQFDDYFFLPDPHKFYKTHLPEDPQWQLLEYPVTLKMFYKDYVSQKEIYAQRFFNYRDTISTFLKQPSYLQSIKTAENAFRFNPNNIEGLAIAYHNYALEILRTRTDQRSLLLAISYFEKTIRLCEDYDFKQAESILTNCDEGIIYAERKLAQAKR